MLVDRFFDEPFFLHVPVFAQFEYFLELDDFLGLAVEPVVAGRPEGVAVAVEDGAERVFAPFEVEERDFGGGGDDLLLDHVTFFVGELDDEAGE